MSDSKRLIGERIGMLRRARNLTQQELAEKVGLDTRHISRLETGKYYPSLDSLELMARVLNVELREFFEFPTVESEEEMRVALIEVANSAPKALLREITSYARNLLSIRPRR